MFLQVSLSLKVAKSMTGIIWMKVTWLSMWEGMMTHGWIWKL